MSFELSFDTDNDAFTDGNGSAEVARILRALATRIEANSGDSFDGAVYDVNGNRIGNFGLDLPASDDEGDEPEDQFRDDVEADADTLASAGYGTYGYYGGDE